MADEKTPDQPHDVDGAARSDDTAEGAATVVVAVLVEPIVAQSTGALAEAHAGRLARDARLPGRTLPAVLDAHDHPLAGDRLDLRDDSRARVAWLTRHKVKRGYAAGVVTLMTVVIVIGVATLLAVPIVNQATEFAQDVPDYIDDLTRPDGYLDWAQERYDIQDKIDEISPKALDFVMGAGTPVLNAVRTSFSMVAAVVSIFTMMVLLLIEGPKLWAWILSLVRSDLRDEAGQFGHNLLYSVGGYVSGNLFISVVAGMSTTVAMTSSTFRSPSRSACSSRSST